MRKLLDESVDARFDAESFLRDVVAEPVQDFGSTIVEQIDCWRQENLVRVLAKASEILAASGFKPRKVSLRSLVPILDAAGGTDDELLVKMYAALISSQLTEGASDTLNLAHARMLGQCTPLDARVLEVHHTAVLKANRPGIYHRGGRHVPLARPAVAGMLGVPDDELAVCFSELCHRGLFAEAVPRFLQVALTERGWGLASACFDAFT